MVDRQGWIEILRVIAMLSLSPDNARGHRACVNPSMPDLDSFGMDVDKLLALKMLL